MKELGLTKMVLFLFLFLLLQPPAFCGASWPAGDPARAARFVAFDPPKIMPAKEYQTVKAGGNYSFRCEGGMARGVSWRLPVEATDDLR